MYVYNMRNKYHVSDNTVEDNISIVRMKLKPANPSGSIWKFNILGSS